MGFLKSYWAYGLLFLLAAFIAWQLNGLKKQRDELLAENTRLEQSLAAHKQTVELLRGLRGMEEALAVQQRAKYAEIEQEHTAKTDNLARLRQTDSGLEGWLAGPLPAAALPDGGLLGKAPGSGAQNHNPYPAGRPASTRTGP